MIGQLGTGEPRRLAVPGSEPADDDAGLLDRSLQRPEVFAAIYSKYVAEVYRYIAGRLGPDAAEDVAAETFLVAFRRRGAFDPAVGSVRPWLYGIATNLISQHQRAETRRYRSLWRSGSGPAKDDDQEERIADRLTAAGLRAPLARALDALPAGDRDVLLLVAIAGLSYAEVAQALAISTGTVGSRLNRARRKVRAALAGLYPVPPEHDTAGGSGPSGARGCPPGRVSPQANTAHEGGAGHGDHR